MFKMLQAIIFDVDGTLLDTKEYIVQSFEYAFKICHVPNVSRDDLQGIWGMILEDCYKKLAPNFDATVLCVAHRAFQKDHMDLVKPFEHTIDTMQKLHQRDIKLAVLSTRQKMVEETLERAGILKYFDCIITGDDVTHIKPHPEGVEKALAQFGVAPEFALMVGDTDADVLAGKNAGTKTAAAMYGLGARESLIDVNPDYMLEDISELVSVVRG